VPALARADDGVSAHRSANEAVSARKREYVTVHDRDSAGSSVVPSVAVGRDQPKSVLALSCDLLQTRVEVAVDLVVLFGELVELRGRVSAFVRERAEDVAAGDVLQSERVGQRRPYCDPAGRRRRSTYVSSGRPGNTTRDFPP
jgi:hypothetical protein